MKVYWDKNNICDYDLLSSNDEYITFEDYARNTLRINKKTLEVEIEIDNKWQSMNKKVYKYE